MKFYFEVSQTWSILTIMLNDRFLVFYDQDAALHALRFAVLRTQTIDVGQHIMLQHYALRTGKFRYRTRFANFQNFLNYCSD